MIRPPNRYCPIEHCEHSYGTPNGSGVSFFCAPRKDIDPKVRTKWIRNIQAHQNYSGLDAQIRICELHFDLKCISTKQKKRLKKGSFPTIFPTPKSPSDAPLNNWPISVENSSSGYAKRSKQLTCNQCIAMLVELSRGSAKLVKIQGKMKKREIKMQELQNELQHTSSQLIPLRIDESSLENQNYIPQKTLKKQIVDSIEVDDNERAGPADKQPIVHISNDTSQAKGVVGKTEPNDCEEDAEDEEDTVDEELPECERQQFAEYVMSSIGDLPEKSAAQAMMVIKHFLQKWPRYSLEAGAVNCTITTTTPQQLTAALPP